MLYKGGAAERLNCFICAVRQGDAMTDAVEKLLSRSSSKILALTDAMSPRVCVLVPLPTAALTEWGSLTARVARDYTPTRWIFAVRVDFWLPRIFEFFNSIDRGRVET